MFCIAGEQISERKKTKQKKAAQDLNCLISKYFQADWKIWKNELGKISVNMKIVNNFLVFNNKKSQRRMHKPANLLFSSARLKQWGFPFTHLERWLKLVLMKQSFSKLKQKEIYTVWKFSDCIMFF